MQENAETILRLGIGIFHAVAAQPSHEKNRRNLAGGVVRSRDKDSQAFAAAVLCPSVEDLGILKVLTLGLGAHRLARKKRSDGGDGEEEKSRGAISDHGRLEGVRCTDV